MVKKLKSNSILKNIYIKENKEIKLTVPDLRDIIPLQKISVLIILTKLVSI